MKGATKSFNPEDIKAIQDEFEEIKKGQEQFNFLLKEYEEEDDDENQKK